MVGLALYNPAISGLETLEKSVYVNIQSRTAYIDKEKTGS